MSTNIVASTERRIGRYLASAFFSALLSVPAIWTVVGSVYGLVREAFCRTQVAANNLPNLASYATIYCRKFHNDFRPDLAILVILAGFAYLALHTVTLRNETPLRQLGRVLLLYLLACAVWIPFRLLPDYVGPFELW